MADIHKIKVGIVGGAGYTGGELIRLLLHHPHVDIVFVHSKSNAGNEVGLVHGDLYGETELTFSATLSTEIDVLFLCGSHGESKDFLLKNHFPEEVKMIDLSQDFRLQANALFNDRQFVYGLPELNRDAIRSAKNIANPGCFATAIQLALVPLAKENLLNRVYITGITGSTGAGQHLSATSHFSWRANNIQAYKTLVHQHVEEIVQSMQQIAGHPSAPEINFVPWRGDFTRGIFISAQLTCNEKLEQIINLYENYYSTHPFTHISSVPIHLKQVVNTNKCVIQLEKVNHNLVVHSAIDNLLKGASGQAVQNMNLMFGFEEDAGLRLKGTGF